MTSVVEDLRDALRRPSGELAVAMALLAGTIMDTSYYRPGALGMATGAAVLAVHAARRARGATAAGDAPRAMRWLLAAVVAMFLGYGLLRYGRAPLPAALLGACVLLLVLELRAAHRPSPGGEAGRLALWTLLAAALVVPDLRARDGSFIDTWTMQQEASAALLRGENPYSIAYRNIYGHTRYFGEGVADSRKVYVFPYPPQTILADLPAYAMAGDVRFACFAALVVAAWGVALLAPAGQRVLAGAAVLFHPGTLNVLRNAWTEPMVLGACALFLLAVRYTRSRPGSWILAGAAGAAFLGAKQYAPLFVAPLVPALPRQVRLRTAALAVGLAAAIALPFALWDLRGLWNGVVLMQARQPFRIDAISWQAAAVRLGLGRPPDLVGFVLAVLALAFTWPPTRTLGRGLACGAAAFLVLVLTAKQAFLNYFWLADCLLLAAVVLLLGEERAPSLGAPATGSRASPPHVAEEGGTA